MLADSIKLLRPHQYVKNGFVLIGTLFSQQWDQNTISQAVTLFIAFCAISSAVYILNDIFDSAADRLHPVKCHRPIASGVISRARATLLLLLMMCISVSLSISINNYVLLFIAGYFVLNVFYSVYLKHIVILDVFVIATGFMLRLLAGTTGLDIAPSHWLLLCGLMVTLFLGFAKRRAELLTLEKSGSDSSRKVLSDYSPILLELMLGITAACTILSYGLYTVSPQTQALHQSQWLILTLPLVMYGMFRYLYLLFGEQAGSDTAQDIFTDRHLLITALLWLLLVIWSLQS